ncbi:MAG: putative Ig domain-containing protein [Solirubrobacteraceae bacterium]
MPFPARPRPLAALLFAVFALAHAALPAGALGAGPFGPLAQQGPKTGVEPAPTVKSPGSQHTPAKAKVNLLISGEHLASLKAEPLPKGINPPTKVGAGETEWELTGAPEIEKEEVEVTLTPENAAKEAGTPVKFKWTVGEAEPTIVAPLAQTSTVGTPITPVVVEGTRLNELQAVELPKGLTLTKVDETKWEIAGTPKEAKAATTVTLAAQNKEKEAPTSTSFKWTVEPEAAPTIEKPADQASVEGVAIAPLIVKGTHLFSLKATGLPPGIEQPVKKSQTEWEIKGTPAAHQPTTPVTLEAQNEERGPIQTQTFNWTVAEAQPTIVKPSDQITQEGKPITPVPVTGTRLAVLKPKALPAGLKLVKRTEAEWEISGTPTSAKAETQVTLEAQNKQQGPVVTQTFNWTVTELEPQPTVEKPADQASVAGAPISPLIVRGSRLAALSAKQLPAGLTLSKLSEAEWEIAGTPTTARAATEVLLEAVNKEGRGSAVRVFNWTVTAVGPAPSGGLTVSPGVVFSASRASCGGVRWPVAAVGTQWLLDGAPLPGATAGTYVPPRADDGHRLACRQTATATNGVSTTVTSAAHVVYEQPPQASWPVVAAAQRCGTPVCMFDGGTTAVQSAQSYAQGGEWLAARQVRCASAPWTSQAGDSAVAAVHGLAAAHAIRVSLQRVTASGAVTILSAHAGPLPEGAAAGGVGGSYSVALGAQPFTAGEMWTKLQTAASGTPNWFAAGAGALFYSAGGAAGVLRSFQLVYELTAADLGATLRCVAGADDGPAGAPTRAAGASPEYRVASSSACAPRRLGAASAPQPALVEPGRTPCLLAPAGPAPLEGSEAAIAVANGRAAIALACALSSCRGTLSLVSSGATAGHAAVRISRGRTGLVRVPLTSTGRRLLARGAVVAVRLRLNRASRTLGTARLVKLG